MALTRPKYVGVVTENRNSSPTYMEDHVSIYLESPPKYSPARVVQMMKNIAAREVSNKLPKLRKQLWASEMWKDDYMARSVGDKITADVIRKYINSPVHENDSNQLNGFSI
jgi:REP element-mobilizing transposase RayT